MSTKSYAKSLEKIAKDRQLKMLTKKDKDTLVKLAQLMKRANEDVSFRDKLSAHDAAMKGIEKYMNVLKQIPAPKKSKAVQKLAMAVQRMFMKKDESVNEKMRPAIKKALAQKGYGPIFKAIDTSKQQLKQLRYSRGEIQDTLIDMFGDEDPKILKKIKEAKQSVNEKLEWDQHDSKMASEIDKVFRMAKIKVLKHVPYKRSHRGGDSAAYGAFIHVKDKKGNKTVVPIEINKKGIITYAGGPRGWHPMEKIGALNMSHARPADFLKIKTYARTIDYLKTFQKLDGWGQDVIYKK